MSPGGESKTMKKRTRDGTESQITGFSIEDLPAGPHRDLYALWHGKRTPERLPGRADFDPDDNAVCP